MRAELTQGLPTPPGGSRRDQLTARVTNAQWVQPGRSCIHVDSIQPKERPTSTRKLWKTAKEDLHRTVVMAVTWLAIKWDNVLDELPWLAICNKVPQERSGRKKTKKGTGTRGAVRKRRVDTSGAARRIGRSTKEGQETQPGRARKVNRSAKKDRERSPGSSRRGSEKRSDDALGNSCVKKIGQTGFTSEQ